MNLTGTALLIKRKYYNMLEPDGMGLHGEIACKSTVSPASGLFPLFDRNELSPQLPPYNAPTLPDMLEFQGVFNNILVNDHHHEGRKGEETAPTPKTTKLKNRKYVTNSETLTIDGTDYKINVTAKSGVFPKILRKTCGELRWMVDKYKRVHVHLFDLHHAGITTTDSKWVRQLFKNAKRKISRHYKTKHIGHLWVREHERGKAQHYHCMIMVDAKKTQYPHYLMKTLKDEWFSICGGSFAWSSEKCYYNLNSKKETFQEIKADIVYRISYRAKQRGKGYRPPQAKDYSTSRLA